MMGQCFKYVKELGNQKDTTKKKEFIYFSTREKHILSNSNDKSTNFLHTLTPSFLKCINSQVAPFSHKSANFNQIVVLLQEPHQRQVKEKKSAQLRREILGALFKLNTAFLVLAFLKPNRK